MGFTDSSHRKIRDGRTDSGDRSLLLGNTMRERRAFVRVVREDPLHIPRDSSCIILPVALLGAIIISLGTRGQEYGPNNVGIILYINNSHSIVLSFKKYTFSINLYVNNFIYIYKYIKYILLYFNCQANFSIKLKLNLINYFNTLLSF